MITDMEKENERMVNKKLTLQGQNEEVIWCQVIIVHCVSAFLNVVVMVYLRNYLKLQVSIVA